MNLNDEIILNGKKYISSRRASEITRYTNDYIGQLCRSGKVKGKLIGRIRFVDEDSLLEYKLALETEAPQKTEQKENAPFQHDDGLPSLTKNLARNNFDDSRHFSRIDTDDVWGKVVYANDDAKENQNRIYNEIQKSSQPRLSPIQNNTISPISPRRAFQFNVSKTTKLLPSGFSHVLLSKIASLLTTLMLVAGSYFIYAGDVPLVRAAYDAVARTFTTTLETGGIIAHQIVEKLNEIIPIPQNLFASTMVYSSDEDEGETIVATKASPLQLPFTEKIQYTNITKINNTEKETTKIETTKTKESQQHKVETIKNIAEKLLITYRALTAESVEHTLATFSALSRVYVSLAVSGVVQISSTAHELSRVYLSLATVSINQLSYFRDNFSDKIARLSFEWKTKQNITRSDMLVVPAPSAKELTNRKPQKISDAYEVLTTVIVGNEKNKKIDTNSKRPDTIIVKKDEDKNQASANEGAALATTKVGSSFVAELPNNADVFDTLREKIVSFAGVIAQREKTSAVALSSTSTSEVLAEATQEVSKEPSVILAFIDDASLKIYRTISGFFIRTKIEIVKGLVERKIIAERDVKGETQIIENKITELAQTETDQQKNDQKLEQLKDELAQIKALGLVIELPAKLTERIIVEKPITQIIKGSSDEEINAKLEQLNNKLVSMINAVSASQTQNAQNVYRAVSLTNKIDSLSNLTASKLTVSGVSGLTDADIPNDITVSNYLLTSGGSITGTLSVSASTTFRGIEYLFPSADGTLNQVLTTNSAGGLSWSTASGGSGVPDWQKETNYNALALTPTTTIPVWLKSALYASSTVIVQGDTTLQNLTAANATTTNATTTSLSVSETASTTNLNVSKGATTTAFYAGGLSQLTSLTAVNATTTSLQVGSLASTSQLIASNSINGHGTLTITGLTTLGNASTSILSVTNTASTTNLIVSSTLSVRASTTFRNIEYLFPSADGTLNQVLTTNSAGGLSWSTASGGTGVPDWQKETNYNALALTPTTTIPVWLKSALYASSTVIVQGDTTLQNLTATNATTTNATTTSLSVSETASTTNLNVSKGATTTAFYAGGLSQLTNLTAVNATTTSLQVAQTASTTKLIVSSTLTANGALTVSGLATLGNASTTQLSASSNLYTALTANSVPFIGASGLLTQDAAHFVFDDTNNRLGIGTSTPFALLSIHGLSNDTNTSQPLFVVASSTASATTTHFIITNTGNVGIGTTSPAQSLGIANRLYVGGTGTSTFENNLEVLGGLKIGTGSLYFTSSGITSTNAFQLSSGGAKFTFPTALGSANQVLQTDASGNLTWVDQTAASASSTIQDQVIINLAVNTFNDLETASTSPQGLRSLSNAFADIFVSQTASIDFASSSNAIYASSTRSFSPTTGATAQSTTTDYGTESDYLYQEWGNTSSSTLKTANVVSGSDTVILNNSGIWPQNSTSSRISFANSFDTTAEYAISTTPTSSTQYIKLDRVFAGTSSSTSNWFMRKATTTGGVMKLNEATAGGSDATSTGGTITSSGGDWIHTFTTSGTFTPNSAFNVEYLVVGGGGGGGVGANDYCGGGGAGGFRTATGFAVTAQGYSITVGNGGAGGNAGASSTFSTITSNGGGAGRNSTGSSDGGSGGGGSSNNAPCGNASETGGTGNVPSTSPSQGNAGGTSNSTAGQRGGGGGGGAGAVGGNAPGNSTGGVGGAGTASSISGSSVTYAGGGGGGGQTGAGGAGGAGGGGTGSGNGGTVSATNGTANTGGGAGGGSSNASIAGGSGIVIIRYTPISGSSLQNNTSAYVSVIPKTAFKKDSTSWSDINSATSTETINSQNTWYWLTFDPTTNFGTATSTMWNTTGSVWRNIARNSNGTWQYNNNSADNATETWVNAGTNDFLHAVSEAIEKQAANRMTGPQMQAISDANWEASGGWATSVNSVAVGTTLYSVSGTQNPQIDQTLINYDESNPAMNLVSKPQVVTSIPTEIHLTALATYTTGTPTYLVSRDNGTNWATVTTMVEKGTYSGATKIYAGSAVVSSQVSSSSLRWRVTTVLGDNITVNGAYLYAGDVTGSSFDYAENFPTKDQSISAGDIVTYDPENNEHILRATSTLIAPLGIISTDPGFLLGSQQFDWKPVALKGRVPVKVNLEGGDIFTGDRITLSSVAGVGTKATTSSYVIGRALENYIYGMDKTSIIVFIENEYMFAGSEIAHGFYIDPASGNLGIGTTTPAYPLHVVGDIAAQGFVHLEASPPSERQYLTEEDNADMLAKITETNLAYLEASPPSATGTSKRRFGLIAEEAPSEVLSVDGKGVDIFKLSTVLFAGVKAQQKEIANLSIRLDSIETLFATTTGQTFGDSLFGWVIARFNTIGITFTQGIVKVTDLVTAKKVVTESIEIGSANIRSGFTLYDKIDGTAHCVQIIGGALSSVLGVCGDSEVNLEASPPSGTTTPPDTTPPTLTINGNNPSLINIGDSYSDLGVTVTDDVDMNLGYKTFVDGALVSQISLDTSTSTTYVITYNATDNTGNTATTTRTVIVAVATAPSLPPIDTTPPDITLIGTSIVSASLNSTYTDAGSTAFDETNGDITANIIVNNPVNTSATSTYTVTYDVADSSGNQATQVTRTVVVE